MAGWLGTQLRRVALLAGFLSVVCAAAVASAASAASPVTVNSGRGYLGFQATLNLSSSSVSVVIRPRELTALRLDSVQRFG